VLNVPTWSNPEDGSTAANIQILGHVPFSGHVTVRESFAGRTENIKNDI
jgi:hypothetical protein